LCAALAVTVSGCGHDPAMLIKITADAKVDQYDLYIRQDSSGEVVFHSGFQPVLAPGEKTEGDTGMRDLTVDALKIAVKLSEGGKYTLLIVGVTGQIEGGKPGAGATQFFWASHVDIDGANEIDARLLSVPAGDDADQDFWPDATRFLDDKPEAQPIYAGHMDLLDCNDKLDNPIGTDGMTLMLRAEAINPFAVEICGDGYDENCNGNDDDPCVDADGDGNPKGMDCDDADPARHKPNPKDPFPDPPNCCGYSLGMAGSADEHKDFTGDATLCPMKRCGDGIDEACRGNSTNDPANDTACITDADCDGYPAENDCDDNDPGVHPGALEICGNAKNESCSPSGADSGCVPCDVDGDGFERDDTAANCPTQMYKDSGKPVDCNDNDAGVYPGASSAAGNKEGGINAQGKVATALKGLCRHYYEATGPGVTAKIPTNGYMVGDADCNGVPFEACPPPSCDADGDGWPANDCGMGLPGPFDCNDNDPTIFPTAPDKCGDGVDGSCSGADTPCNGMDKDGDGYLPPSDCDDSNPNVHPFALELCNGIDDDCDGDKDEGNPDPMGAPLVNTGVISSCTDDNDGECAKMQGRCVCSPTAPVVAQDPSPLNRVTCSGWDSTSARIPHCFGAGQPHPQSCDAIDRDDDCNGSSSDLTGMNLLMKGQACGLTLGTCKQGTVSGCDRNQTMSPYYGGQATADNVHWICTGVIGPQAEKCNGFDDDCDGSVPGNELDPDNDKYMACSGCGGLTLAGMLVGCNDCQPAIATAHPGATELCNNIDDNCDSNNNETPNECGATAKTCCYANGGVCQDLNNDTNYCGSCGNSCAGKIFVNMCAGGACICKNQGAACGARNWCDPGNNAGTCTLCNTKAHCGDACTACTGTNVCKPDGSACTGCNIDSDCDVSAGCSTGTCFCNGGTCTQKKPLGGGCTVTGDPEIADNECLGTAYCTDGVCCDKAPSMCGGCNYCNRTGPGASPGTCSIVQPSDTSSKDPHSFCTPSMAGCKQDLCNGSSGGAAGCNVPDTTNCSAVTCVDNAAESHTQAQQCTAGSCGASPVPITPCNDYKCNTATGNSCLGSCASDTQCQSGKPFCFDANGGDGKCYLKHPRGDTCGVNSDCDSGACVQTKCCGMGTRPPSCGAVTGNTSCTNAVLTTYTCASGGANYNSCTGANSNCGGSGSAQMACASTTACPANCSCTGGSGAAPCYNPPRAGDNSNCFNGGSRCVNETDTMCTACNVDGACGATCADCTAGLTCLNGVLSGGTCTGGGTTCGGTQNCPGSAACATAGPPGTCKNAANCTADSDCITGKWCKNPTHMAGGGSCLTRIASNSNCDDADCGTTLCLQCNNGGTGVVCPTGAGQQKCP
jgi:hypothetical protein